MQRHVPCTLYRGGTSKGPLFFSHDLPPRGPALDRTLLAIMGSPNRRQIDGLGGAETLTSKVVIVSKSERPDCDVDYLFAQVTPGSSIVDYESNCGNMLSAIGPFVIEKGIVKPAKGDTTDVRIYNVNTDSIIVAKISTPGGQVTYEGDAAIDGVDGTAAPVVLNFARTVGSRTSGLLPTGAQSEQIDGVRVSLVDVAVPTMIVAANDLGKTGHEPKAILDADKDLIARLEGMRREAGRRMGLGNVADMVIPKPLMVSRPASGGTITSRDFVPHNCHATHSVTGAMALSAACLLPGTVAQELAVTKGSGRQDIVIEHPSGKMAIAAQLELSNKAPELKEASLLRTCRKLMEGSVFYADAS